MSEDGIFMKIVRREIPADILYQDEHVTAFRDIAPQAPVHVLVVPNRPILTVAHAERSDEATLGRMLSVAGELAKELGIADSGFRLIANAGEDGGQEVPHLHIHLVGGVPLGKMLAGAE